MMRRQIIRALKQVTLVPPPESLDQRVAGTLGQLNSATLMGPHSRSVNGYRGWMATAAGLVMLVGTLAVISSLLSNPSIAWADVARRLEQDLQSLHSLHVKITTFPAGFDDIGLSPSPYIQHTQIWIQHPLQMRKEELGEMISNPTEEQKGDWSSTPQIDIYNDKGHFVSFPAQATWGHAEPSAVTVAEGIPYEQWLDQQLENIFGERFWWPSEKDKNVAELAKGRFIEKTHLRDEKVTVYDFIGPEQRRYRAWLRDSDQRALKVEVYKAGIAEPVFVYDPIEYGMPIAPETFAFTAPAGYRNGQLLGFEDQPHVINPSVVGLVEEQSSASFYKLQAIEGQDRDAALAAKTNTTPDLRILIDGPVEECSWEGHEMGTNPDGSVAFRNSATANNPAGILLYGVRREGVAEKTGQKLVDLVPHTDYKGGRIVFQLLCYRTDRRYIKAAYDADGDGVMDAWAQVPQK